MSADLKQKLQQLLKSDLSQAPIDFLQKLQEKLVKVKDLFDEPEDYEDESSDSDYEGGGDEDTSDDYYQSFEDEDADDIDEDSYEGRPGFQVIDPADEDLDNDEAGKWLREQESAKAKPSQPAQSSAPKQSAPEPDIDEQPEEDLGDVAVSEKPSSSKWQPNEKNYTDQHRAKIKELMDRGFSHREAERFAGAHAGPRSFEEALNSRHDLPEMSQSFFDRLKPLADTYVKKWGDRRVREADAEKNPDLARRGKLLAEHESRDMGWNDAWNKHKESDEYKALSPVEKLSAKKKFRDSFYQQNPEHVESFKQVGGKGSKADYYKPYDESANEQLASLLTMHFGDGPSMSNEEAGQALGSEQREGGGYNMNVNTAMGSFARQHKGMLQGEAQKRATNILSRYEGKMDPQRMDRLKRVSAMKTSSAAKPPKTPTGGGEGDA